MFKIKLKQKLKNALFIFVFCYCFTHADSLKAVEHAVQFAANETGKIAKKLEIITAIIVACFIYIQFAKTLTKMSKIIQ